MKIWRLALIGAISTLLNCTMPKTIEKNMYGFTVQNWKARALEIPMSLTHLGQRITLKEDSFAYDEQRKIACVADGVTRDFLDGSVVTHDLKGIMKFLNGEYPSPSPAREAADIFTKIFMQTDSFRQANEETWKYNKEHGFIPSNFLDKDLAGCTAATASEVNGNLYWRFIDDSGIAIIDENGNLKFKTPDEGPHSPEKLPYLEKILNQYGGFDNPEGRRIIKSQYRNNPSEKYAYGVLTGEETALQYVKEGTQNINFGDYVLLYTDGVGDIIFKRNEKLNKEFINKLVRDDFRGLEKLCKREVSTEGTLVVYKVE